MATFYQALSRYCDTWWLRQTSACLPGFHAPVIIMTLLSPVYMMKVRFWEVKWFLEGYSTNRVAEVGIQVAGSRAWVLALCYIGELMYLKKIAGNFSLSCWASWFQFSRHLPPGWLALIITMTFAQGTFYLKFFLVNFSFYCLQWPREGVRGGISPHIWQMRRQAQRNECLTKGHRAKTSVEFHFSYC